MAASGYTPISLYYSTTASAAPTAGNLVSGELAINITDGKLYYKDNAGAVQLLSTSTTATGTANGVLYLNGSKVATSGSALVFDGSKLAINLATPDANLNVNGYTGNGTLRIGGATTGESVLYFADASSGTGSYAGYLQYIHTSDALAFGAASDERMRLTSTGLGIGTTSPTAKVSTQVANGLTPSMSMGNTAAGLTYSWYASDTAKNGFNGLGLYDGTDFRLVVNSSGNLGLGVTPSAWGGSWKALELPNGIAYTTAFGINYQTVNAYHDGSNFIYKNSSVASYYQNGPGSHAWHIAGSGTAGNAISFTQAMTLDSSGNLGIGVTSVASTLHVNVTGGSDDTLFSYGANQDNFITAGSSGVTIFRNLGTERARIDSSGNLLVGTTSLTGPIVSGGSGVVLRAAGQIYANDTYLNVNADGTIMQFRRSGTAVGSISVTTTATAYNTSSDQRLKENIVNAPEFGSVIDAIQVRSFDWKTDQTHQRAGFIAQELVSVAPEAVYQPDDSDEMMAVDYSKLVPMLVKEIQSLRARVAALES